MTDDSRDPTDQFRQLGDFITREIPYGRAVSMPSDPSAHPLVEKDGLLPNNDADNPVAQFGPDAMTPDDLAALHNWEFQGQSVSIVKALRIPYTFVREDGQFVQTHILIGYEGPSYEATAASGDLAGNPTTRDDP